MHGCLLLDRCRHCNEPFSVLRQDSKGEIACRSCGANIARFASDEAPVDAREVQRELLGFASQGWWPMGEYSGLFVRRL
ncbi:MAG: hypothetical protein H3C38_13640 [Rhodospirillales bacterium]|nr:hypothetical protein [Rhodospirillales bacterium]